MKIDPNVSLPNIGAARPNGEPSEARRAFEAMLSANTTRSRIAPNSIPPQANSTSAKSKTLDVVEVKQPEMQSGFIARPGRVLDIKV